jgi:hypothetical protein
VSLSDVEIDWFARQIVVPGIGAQGQRRLLDASITVYGHPVGVEAAISYAQGTGIRAGTEHDPEAACIVAAGIDDVDEQALRRMRDSKVPVIWYAVRDGILTGGVRTTGSGPFPEPIVVRPRGEPRPKSAAAHRIAGCDAVGSAVCVILGWRLPEPFEVRLG